MAAEFKVSIGADIAGLNSGLNSAENRISSFVSKVNKVGELGDVFQNIGAKLTAGLTLPIIGLGAASIKSFGEIQSLQKGLEAVMGSASAAGSEFEKLKEVAKLPGLGLNEAVRGSVSLQAAGFSADQARESLLAFGNALATVGKGKNELNFVILALTQLQNKSSGFGQDLRQLTEQLPQLRGALTDAFGTADSEAIAKLGITGAEVVQRITKEFAKLPPVTGGIKNAFENLSDSINVSLGKVGQIIDKNLNITGLLEKVSNGISKLVGWFEELSPSTQTAILSVAGLAAAIGPLLIGIGGLMKTLPLLVAETGLLRLGFVGLLSPIGLFTTAAVLLGTTIALNYKETKTSTERNKEWADSLAKATANARIEISALETLYQKTQNTKISTDERKKAVDKLQESYPKYFANIKDEIILNGGAEKSYLSLKNAILLAARAKAAQSEIEKRAQERLNEELDLREKLNKQLEIYKNPKPIQNVRIGSTGGNVSFVDVETVKNDAKAAAFAIIQQLKQLGATYKQQDAELLRIIEEGQPFLEKGAEGSGDAIVKGLEKAEKKLKGKKVNIEFETPTPLTDSKAFKDYQKKSEEDLAWEREMFQMREDLYYNHAEAIRNSTPLIAKALTDQQIAIKEMNLAIQKEFEEIAESSAVSSLQNLFGDIGNAIGEGGNLIAAIGRSLIGSFGAFLSQMGDMLIKYGTLAVVKGKLDLAIAAGGPTAIAAGIAAIAVGALLKVAGAALGSAASKGFGGGSGSYSGSTSSATGDSSSSYTSSSTVYQNGGFNDEVVFKINGYDLIGVISKNQDRLTRLGN